MIDRQGLRDEYEKYSSEHLLTLRARGEELVPEAHEIIEEVFRIRGETLPPPPARPITDEVDPAVRQSLALKLVLGVALIVGGQVLIQITKSSQAIGIPVTLACLGYLWWDWQRKSRLVSKQRARLDAQKRIGTAGFTELMFCAADGDLARASDLLNYGARANAQDDNGASALHYAAREGQRQIVELLLSRGADRTLRTKAGKTAIEYAVAEGHAEIANALSRAATLG